MNLDQVMARVTPLIDAAVRRAIDAALARYPGVRVIPGVVLEVNGPWCQVLPDDAENGAEFIEATRTGSTQVRGDRVLIFHGPKGAAWVVGRIPQE